MKPAEQHVASYVGREESYDAVIVGARVAGAATALLLARAGLRVLVIDRARYGTDTLSTHAFMRGGVMQLGRWGLLDDLVAAGTTAIHRTVIRYGDVEEVVRIKPSPYVDALYAPTRAVLDRVLADAATAAGAEVRFETALTGLARDRDGVVVGIEAHDRTGSSFRALAPITIGADGVRSAVARDVGALTYLQGQHASAMVVGYWSDVEADGYQWLYGPGLGAGVIPTNDGQVSVWAAMPDRRFREQLRWRPDMGFSEVLRAVAPDWADRLERGRRDGPLRGFPGIPGYLRQPWGRGWALVGDASHFKDPLTTHGMTDALRDAEILARAVTTVVRGDAPADRALACYQQTRDRLSQDLLMASDRVASYDWDMGDLRDLLLGVSTAMRPELEYLRNLDASAAAVA